MPATLHFFPAQSGNETARLDFPDGRCIHLHSSIQPEHEALSLRETPIWGETVILLGVGLGYQLDRIDFENAKRVILVDVHADLLEKAAQRLSQRINQLGCVLASQTDRLLRALRSVPQSTVQIVRHPPSVHAYPRIYSEVEKAIVQERQASRKSTYSRTDLKKKVLLMKGRFFLETETAEALEQSPLTDLSILPYLEHAPGSPRESAFAELLEREQPDLILSIGFKGFDPEGRLFEMAERRGIPVAVWFLDDPRTGTLAFEKTMGNNVHAFVWDSAYVPWLQQRSFAHVSTLPLGASAAVFSQRESPKARIPLSFVGSAFTMNSPFMQKIKNSFLWDPSLQPWVNTRVDALLAGQLNALTAAEGKMPFEDEKNRIWLANVIVHSATHYKRAHICRALTDEGLHTIGDPEGWREILGTQATCLPPVDYYNGLAEVYQNSEINLNITSCQMPTTVNQRLFDVPLAGGFLLTDPQADAFQLFEEGQEVVVYRSVEDAADKIRYYRARPRERASIAQKARQRVLGEHLVVHRMQHILNEVFRA